MASAPAALRMVNELGALLPQGQALGGAGVIVGQHGNAGRALGQAGVAVGLLGGLQVPARLGQLAGLQRELTGHHRFQRQFLSGRGPYGGLGRHRRQGLAQARDSSRTLGMRINAGIVGIGALKCRPMASSLSQATEQ
jgi:hypothetical protein